MSGVVVGGGGGGGVREVDDPFCQRLWGGAPRKFSNSRCL